jgi:hypothetical protein
MRTFLRGKITLLFMMLGMLLAVPAVALAAELVTSELDTTTPNAVTVTQGGSTNFNIGLRATGSISNLITETNASIATVDTAYSLDGAGTFTKNTPSSGSKFFSSGDNPTGTNSTVTWTGAPNPYSVAATISAAATTPTGAYTLTLSPTAGDTSVSNPSVGGGKLEDGTASTITVNVVAPPCTNPADPTFSGTPNGDNGWYKTTPTVSATSSTSGAVVKYSDAANGTYSTTAPTLGQGTTTVYAKAFSSTGSCSSAAVSNTYKVDTIAPSITDDGTTQTPNAAGWFKNAVLNNFSATDATSGLADPTQANFSVSSGTAEGNAVKINSGPVSDLAGNTNAGIDSAAFKIDMTNPMINGSASPAANTNGWNNSDVTVSFECSDETSGVPAGNCPADVVLSEGADQSVTRSVTDAAGNTASDTVSDIDIDKTDPLVSLNGGPADGQSYYFGSVPDAPTCSASDALSGLDGACSVSGYSNAVGTHTVKASAKDKAGNTNEASSTYTVLAWTTKGFFAPVDMGGVFNSVKGGSTVPLKFELFAGAELTDPASVKSLTYSKVTCDGSAPVDEIETVATGGTSLRYDSTSGQFVYNWKTPTGAGCYKATMTAQDGTTISAFFKTR